MVEKILEDVLPDEEFEDKMIKLADNTIINRLTHLSKIMEEYEQKK